MLNWLLAIASVLQSWPKAFCPLKVLAARSPWPDAVAWPGVATVAVVEAVAVASVVVSVAAFCL
jgi:hypothetical protein